MTYLLCANIGSSRLSAGKSHACFHFPAGRHNISGLFIELLYWDDGKKIHHKFGEKLLKVHFKKSSSEF